MSASGELQEPEDVHVPGDLPLERGLVSAFGALDAAPRVPERFGSYRITGVLGSGGMGVVYDALQASPSRRVALKVIRPGHATRELRRRFTREAECLGRLQHPGIARIYESGVADEGLGPQPFVAMEAIDGLLLDAWCRQARPTIIERVELMARVSEAVHHAHQRSVVHRDLKPGNVMVEPDGSPKVVDFGVARVLAEDGDTQSLLTSDGQFVGTLPYMSPEQIRGDPRDVDTRSDVYSLGALLYEVLSGHRPLEVSTADLVTSITAICTEEPVPLGRRDPELRGDLETIAAKAMAKAPDRRYESAAALGDDLRRVLGNEPILARPASRLYRARKFVARNRVFVASTLAVMAALVVGVALALRSAAEESRMRELADTARHDAQVVTYATQMQSASDALRNGELRTVNKRLDQTDPALRGWAWHYLDTWMRQYALRTPLASRAVGGWPVGCFSPDASRFAYVGGHADGPRFEELDWTTGSRTTLVARLPEPGHRGGRNYDQVSYLLHLGDRGWLVHRNDGRLEFWPRGREDEPKLVSASSFPRDPEVHTYRGTRTHDGRHAVIPQGGASTRGDGQPALLRVLDLVTLAVVTRIEIDDATWHCNAAVDDGLTLLAETSRGMLIRLRRLPEGDVIRTLRGHDNVVHCLDISPDGSRLVSVGKDKQLCLWALPSGRLLGKVHTHAGGEIDDLRFSPDGAFVVSSTLDGMVQVFDAELLRRKRAIFDRIPTSWVAWRSGSGAPRFHPDGKRLLAATMDDVRVWELAAQPGHEIVGRHPESALSAPYVYDVAYSADGARLFSAGWDGTVRAWDAHTHEPLATFECGAMMMALAVDGRGRWVAAAGRDVVLVWDQLTGARVARRDLPGVLINDLTFSPDGRELLAGGALTTRGGPRHYQARVLSLAAPSFEGRELETPFLAAHREVMSLACDSDRPRLLFGTRRGVVCQDRESGRVEWHYEALRTGKDKAATDALPRDFQVADLAVDAANRRVFCCMGPDGLRTLDLDQGSLIRARTAHVGHTFAVARFPGGARLVTAGSDDVLRVWDDAGHELVALRGHEDYVKAVAVAPGGGRVASASGDGTLRQWFSVPLAERREVVAARRAVAQEVRTTLEALWAADAATASSVLAIFQARADVTPARVAIARNVLLLRATTQGAR